MPRDDADRADRLAKGIATAREHAPEEVVAELECKRAKLRAGETRDDDNTHAARNAAQLAEADDGLRTDGGHCSSGVERDPEFEASVSFRISQGPFTASWGDNEADIRTMVDSFGFGDGEGRLRLNCGGSMDPQFGSGTGLEVWIDQDDFMPVLEQIDDEWPGVNIQFDGGETDA